MIGGRSRRRKGTQGLGRMNGGRDTAEKSEPFERFLCKQDGQELLCFATVSLADTIRIVSRKEGGGKLDS